MNARLAERQAAARQRGVLVEASKRRRTLWLVTALVILVIVAGTLRVTARTHPTVTDLGLVRSNLDGWGWTAERDCGYSAPLETRPRASLWVFCDGLFGGVRGETAYITSTAAQGPGTPGAAPSELREIATDGTPAQFIPQPSGVPCPRLSATAAYVSPWASGAVSLRGTTSVLVPYIVTCVQAPLRFIPEQFGIALWDTASGRFSSNVAAIFARSSGLARPFLLGTPIQAGAYLYLYAATCASIRDTHCAGGNLFVARVRLEAGAAPSRTWEIASNYRWRGARGEWSSAAHAVSIVRGLQPLGVSVDWYPRFDRFLMIEQTSVDGDFRLWQASAPVGPWSHRAEGRLPRCHSAHGELCRAILGHPELSRAHALTMSFYEPETKRVRLVSMRL